MMYLREDSRCPMSCSREQFNSEWDRIFSGVPIEQSDRLRCTDGERCSACGNSCLELLNTDLRDIILDNPAARVEYYGYCHVKRTYVFKVFMQTKLSCSNSTNGCAENFQIPGFLFRGVVPDNGRIAKIVNLCYLLISKKDSKHISKISINKK